MVMVGLDLSSESRFGLIVHCRRHPTFTHLLPPWPIQSQLNQKKPSGDKKQKDGVGSSVSVQAEAIALIKKFGTQGTLKQEVALRMLQAMDEL